MVYPGIEVGLARWEAGSPTPVKARPKYCVVLAYE
jgi:hypothetical protein